MIRYKDIKPIFGCNAFWRNTDNFLRAILREWIVYYKRKAFSATQGLGLQDTAKAVRRSANIQQETTR